MNGQFHVHPKNLSPWVKWGQNVILDENNPSHDFEIFIYKIFRDFSKIFRAEIFQHFLEPEELDILRFI